MKLTKQQKADLHDAALLAQSTIEERLKTAKNRTVVDPGEVAFYEARLNKYGPLAALLKTREAVEVEDEEEPADDDEGEDE